MKVKDLISELQRFDGDKTVVLSDECHRAQDIEEFDMNFAHESQCEIQYNCKISEELEAAEKNAEAMKGALKDIETLIEEITDIRSMPDTDKEWSEWREQMDKLKELTGKALLNV